MIRRNSTLSLRCDTVLGIPNGVPSKNSTQGSSLPQQCPRGASFRWIKDRFSVTGLPGPQASRLGMAGCNPPRNRPRMGLGKGRTHLLMITPLELACSSLRPPHDNSNSAFRPAADGTGSVHWYRSLIPPLGSAGCPARDLLPARTGDQEMRALWELLSSRPFVLVTICNEGGLPGGKVLIFASVAPKSCPGTKITGANGIAVEKLVT
jgi:hypothetical protein